MPEVSCLVQINVDSSELCDYYVYCSLKNECSEGGREAETQGGSLSALICGIGKEFSSFYHEWKYLGFYKFGLVPGRKIVLGH